MTPLEAMMFAAEVSDRSGRSRRARNEETLMRLVGGQIAGGDYAGGSRSLLEAGQVEPGMAMQQMGQEKARAAGMAYVKGARQLLGMPEEQRYMAAPRMAVQLEQFGIDTSKMDFRDLSDAKLNEVIASLAPHLPPPEPVKAGPGDMLLDPRTGQPIGAQVPFKPEESTDAGAMGDPAARLFTSGTSIEMANDALDTAKWYNTGLMGRLRGEGSELNTQLEMLKANNAFLGLAELAAQGVRLTPISNADLQVAGNMVANLSPTQGTETLKANIRQVRDRYVNIYQQVLRGVQEQYPDGNVPQNVAAVVRMFEESLTGLAPPSGVTPAASDVGGASAVSPPPEAVDMLRGDPSPEAQREFDEIFGAGAAQRVLGGG
jgi:hypothetical protein